MTTEPVLKFYGHIQSPTCRAVQALLAIGKIPHEPVIVEFFNGQAKTKEHLSKFPFGHIPAITLGELNLGESGAILAFLSDKYPDKIPQSYYPKDLNKRAKVNEVLSWYQSEFRQALSSIFLLKFYGVIVRKEAITTEKLRNADRSIEDQLKLFDRLLATRKYAAGSHITIADLLLYFELTNMMLYQKEWSKYTYVDAWFKLIYAVPQVKHITHSWFPTVKQIIELLNNIQPQDAKL